MHWSVLGSARAHWQSERDRFRKLGPTTEERTALEPLIRRKAVLAATDELGKDLHVWLAVVVLTALATLPTLTLLATGRDLDATALLLTYLLYIPSLFLWLVAVGVWFMVVADYLEERPQWQTTLLSSVAVAGATVGMALLFNYLRHSPSNLLAGVFAATLLVALTAVLLLVELPRADERHRKQFGALGLNSSAALILLAEWELLAAHRRDWRTGSGRRSLVKELRKLIKDAATQLERSAAANHGDVAARRWAERYVVRLTTAVRGHLEQLLLIDQQRAYDELIATVRRTTVELTRGAWDGVGPAGELPPRITWRRRLARFFPVVVLGLAAVFAGAVPGIDSADLLTVRLSLLIPAALSLLPAGHPGQSTLSDAFRDAVGKMRS